MSPLPRIYPFIQSSDNVIGLTLCQRFGHPRRYFYRPLLLNSTRNLTYILFSLFVFFSSTNDRNPG